MSCRGACGNKSSRGVNFFRLFCTRLIFLTIPHVASVCRGTAFVAAPRPVPLAFQEYGGQSKWKNKDIIGCMLDMDNGVMAFTHNGVPQGVAFTDLDTAEWLYPAASFGSAKEGGGVEFNFGATQFVHEPPKGFLALDPAYINLPPVSPFPRLFAFMDCCHALLSSGPLPPFCRETAEVGTDKSLREVCVCACARPCTRRSDPPRAPVY